MSGFHESGLRDCKPNLIMMRNLTLMFYCRKRPGNTSHAQPDRAWLTAAQCDDPFTLVLACGIVNDFTCIEQKDGRAFMRDDFEMTLFEQPWLAGRLTEHCRHAIHRQGVMLATEQQA
jgi:hypothetical protein